MVALLALAAVLVVVLGATSTRWFCAEGCHKVQDDTILAYQRSSHSEISCMACHMPVAADPITFVLHKAEALGELYLTVTGNFELPLNGESEVALTMESRQCTQCHNLAKRKVTPTRGILIEHDVHEEAEVTCAVCHNRIAHKEDFELTLKDPKTKEPNHPHVDFMSMTACFRCHTHGDVPEGGIKAPGACIKCHPTSFELKPASHRSRGFFPEGHAKLGQEEASRVADFELVSKAKAESGGAENSHGGEDGVGAKLVKVESINECSTCHSTAFCSDCHGLPMPHPANFLEGHDELGKSKPKVCSNCHGSADKFCDECHHGEALDVEYDGSKNWIREHPKTVSAVGAAACFKCHTATYCAKCHVAGGVLNKP